MNQPKKTSITVEMTKEQAAGLTQLVDCIVWTDLNKLAPEVKDAGQIFQALLLVKRALEDAGGDAD